MKWRRRRPAEELAGGEDSFLDIVANLVGILVILVMVIGVRAQDAWVDSAETESDQVSEDLLKERDRTLTQHRGLTENVHEIQQRADEIGALLNSRQRERQQLQVLLTAARMELDERRAKLDQAQQAEVLASAESRELEAELARIDAQRRSLEAEASQPLELEHLPTPLARTVFGSEEHFRLKGGRLAYVPLNELTDLLKDEAPRKIWRLREVPQITETLGPIQGFHLRYTMHRRSVETTTQVGPVVRQIAELKQFVLVPLSDQLGETFEEALQSDSQFAQILETRRPGATVITVWTYPDSFQEYRQLKKWLFDRGFSSAARPLPEGQPISGSPDGSRSAAQ